MADRERVVEFIRELGRRAAGREELFPFGVAHFHDELPRVWSRNYLLAEQNLESATAPLLAAEADRILGGEGLAHRKVEVNDEGPGERLEPGFKSLGWDVNCDVLMVERRKPDRPIDTSHVEEVAARDLEAVWAEGIRVEPYGGDDEVVRQLVANKRVLMDAMDTRFFAARVDGAVASYCDLYSNGNLGQIEAVGTLEEFRNRGLARATVSRALEASRKAGNDLTFLMALRDDWPKELYRKLGFDEIGRVYEFVKPAGA